MMIWPKYSSSPSILTRRSMASLIDSSRPLCTLTTYQRLLLGGGGSSGTAVAPGGAPSAGGSSSRGGSWGVVDDSSGMEVTQPVKGKNEATGFPLFPLFFTRVAPCG